MHLDSTALHISGGRFQHAERQNCFNGFRRLCNLYLRACLTFSPILFSFFLLGWMHVQGLYMGEPYLTLPHFTKITHMRVLPHQGLQISSALLLQGEKENERNTPSSSSLVIIMITGIVASSSVGLGFMVLSRNVFWRLCMFALEMCFNINSKMDFTY